MADMLNCLPAHQPALALNQVIVTDIIGLGDSLILICCEAFLIRIFRFQHHHELRHCELFRFTTDDIEMYTNRTDVIDGAEHRGRGMSVTKADYWLEMMIDPESLIEIRKLVSHHDQAQ